jgi:single-stranded-DNA-specific exonuclease
MHWNIKARIPAKDPTKRRQQIIKTLLANRGLTTPRQIKEFVNPPKPSQLKPSKIGINTQQLAKSLKRVKKAIKNQEQIIIYGDYDTDGVCATAIIWEVLYLLGAKVIPFIPSREAHGYGLSISGIKDILTKPIPGLDKPITKPSLIITVDNGIVAHQAAEFVKKQKIDLIITDHHTLPSKLPSAFAIIHTTQLSGAGVSWMLARELSLSKPKLATNTLDLATIGTVADLVPLVGANRSIVKWGFNALKQTQRLGLKSLFRQAGINAQDLTTYHINFIIAPRLNAMGRLEHAIDSVRLLCTHRQVRAHRLADLLGETNRIRQELTWNLVAKAKQLLGKPKDKLIIIDHEEFHEGVIGLIAGKLVEEYYRPTIIISRGREVSKASARSISGVNIIETIRQVDSLLINAGGHPLAAGFTIATKNLNQLKHSLISIADQTITKDHLQKKLDIDCTLNLNDITFSLYQDIEKLAPFGIGNPHPVFAISKASILSLKAIGQDNKHLKLILSSSSSTKAISAIGFGFGNLFTHMTQGGQIDLAYTLDLNQWNGKKELQLKIKDIVI